MSPKTQAAYISAVYGLAKNYHQPPDQISDEALKNYMFYLAQERKLSASSLNQITSGLRLFYKTVVHRSVDFLWPCQSSLLTQIQFKSYCCLLITSILQLSTIKGIKH